MPTQSHDAATLESFRRDPHLAAEYLNAVLEDGDQDEVMFALRRLAEAFGGVPAVAAQANLDAIPSTEPSPSAATPSCAVSLRFSAPWACHRGGADAVAPMR